jgi:hypothetical protein
MRDDHIDDHEAGQDEPHGEAEAIELTPEQGDALYAGVGSLMATLRHELPERHAARELTAAEDEAAERERLRWRTLWDDLSEQGCNFPGHAPEEDRPATVRIHEDREWVATSSLLALLGAAHIVALTIEHPLSVEFALDQIKVQLGVVQGLERLLDRLGWPMTIPVAPTAFPWPQLTNPPRSD